MLVVADKVSATQTISFAQPLETSLPCRWRLQLDGDTEWLDAEQRERRWHELQPHVLVLSRHAEGQAPALAALARRHGVPMVFHIDDDLLAVPDALGEAKVRHYRDPARLAGLRQMLDEADLVYASTAALAERLAEHGVRSRIVAGELYCTPADAEPPPLRPCLVPTIGYMGTGGHSQDLAMVMPAIARLMDRIPTLRFETYGTLKPPREMAAYGDRYCHHAGEADYGRFLAKLADLGWWVGLAPLEDNRFNRCKADTKWVEYSWCGVAVVASDLPVYHRACGDGAGLLAEGDLRWHDAMARLVQDGAFRAAQIEAARRRLRSVYARQQLQQQVQGILDRVVDAAGSGT